MSTEAWKGNPYNLAHLAVKKVRGSASTHLCVGCGGPARDWSLKADPVGPVLASESSNYSTNVEDYEARCRACHTAVDDNTAAARGALASLRSPSFSELISARTREGIRRSRERRAAAGGSGSWGKGLQI